MSDLELPPRLRVDGPRLIKPNGREWLGRGVSYGAFWEDAPLDAPDVLALGANVVRILLRWWGLHGSAGNGRPPIDSRDNDAFAFVRRANFQYWLDMIAQATAAGLWVIPAIDSNCGQSGTQNPETVAYCDPYGLFGAQGRNFWTDKPMRKLYAALWQTIAAALRPFSHIAMLEIQPEPLDGRGPQWAQPIRDFYNYMADAIREVDADTPFLVGARGGYDVMNCAEAFDARRSDFIYTGNLLSGYVTNAPKFDKGLAALTALRDQHGVPIFCQQLGRKTADDADLAYMRRALEQMNANGVGFAWWQWKQNTTNPAEYALNFKDPAGAGWVAKQDEQNLLSEFL